MSGGGWGSTSTQVEGQSYPISIKIGWGFLSTSSTKIYNLHRCYLTNGLGGWIQARPNPSITPSQKKWEEQHHDVTTKIISKSIANVMNHSSCNYIHSRYIIIKINYPAGSSVQLDCLSGHGYQHYNFGEDRNRPNSISFKPEDVFVQDFGGSGKSETDSPCKLPLCQPSLAGAASKQLKFSLDLSK